MARSDFPLIGQLDSVENRFLEVLIEQFELRRNGAGFELIVDFNKETPAIWSTDGKRYVREKLFENFARDAERYQTELDAILVDGTAAPKSFCTTGFPFRYVSGGTLPVIRMGDGKEYYCCFYRPEDPVGWNIANGGSDDRNELKNPILALERELREELVILNPSRKQLYTFAWDEAVNLNVAEYAEARALLRELSPTMDFATFEQVTVPLMWLKGPDVVKVRFEGNDLLPLQGCFLNINAIDFGIEVDRIAWMELGDGVRLYDGDAPDGRLQNRIVGLFEIHKMHGKLGESEFKPDRFYYKGKEYAPSDFDGLTKELFPTVIREERQKDWLNAENQWDLCPVTSRLLRRYVKSIGSWPQPEPQPEPQPVEDYYDVFLCYGGGDKTLAEDVCHHLTNQGLSTFFSSEQIQPGADWLRMISKALRSAQVLLAVAADPRRLKTPFAMFECLTFYVHLEEDLRNREQKKVKKIMVPLVVGGDPKRLPEILRRYHAIDAPDLSLALAKFDDWWRSQ